MNPWIDIYKKQSRKKSNTLNTALHMGKSQIHNMIHVQICKLFLCKHAHCHHDRVFLFDLLLLFTLLLCIFIFSFFFFLLFIWENGTVVCVLCACANACSYEHRIITFSLQSLSFIYALSWLLILYNTRLVLLVSSIFFFSPSPIRLFLRVCYWNLKIG